MIFETTFSKTADLISFLHIKIYGRIFSKSFLLNWTLSVMAYALIGNIIEFDFVPTTVLLPSQELATYKSFKLF